MKVLRSVAFFFLNLLRALNQLFSIDITENVYFNLLHCILFTDLGNEKSSGDLYVDIKSVESQGLCTVHSSFLGNQLG